LSQVVIGIESTAHTAGVGIITSEGKILSNQRAVYIPEEGGIHPREAANHHTESLPELFRKALKEAKLEPNDISLVSYARGPGLGPCLRTGATAARAFAYSHDIPLLGVNHCVAHLEIGILEGATDPVLLYLSGGNTQVIAYAAGRFRVFGETLDIGIGNGLDKFAREAGMGFPGGPKLEKVAKGPELLDLPYSSSTLCFTRVILQWKWSKSDNQHRFGSANYTGVQPSGNTICPLIRRRPLPGNQLRGQN